MVDYFTTTNPATGNGSTSPEGPLDSDVISINAARVANHSFSPNLKLVYNYNYSRSEVFLEVLSTKKVSDG